MAGKRRGIVVSREFVKPAGFDILVPKGSSALRKVEQIAKQKLAAEKKRAAEERRQATARKEAAQRQNLSYLESELAKVLHGKRLEVSGSADTYTTRGKMRRFFLTSKDGKHVQVFEKIRPGAEEVEVTTLAKFTLAIRNAAREARLI